MAKKKSVRRKSPTVACMPSMDRKWEIESAADTLLRAEKIKTDKALMRDAKKELKSRASAAIKAAK